MWALNSYRAIEYVLVIMYHLASANPEKKPRKQTQNKKTNGKKTKGDKIKEKKQ